MRRVSSHLLLTASVVGTAILALSMLVVIAFRGSIPPTFEGPVLSGVAISMTLCMLGALLAMRSESTQSRSAVRRLRSTMKQLLDPRYSDLGRSRSARDLEGLVRGIERWIRIIQTKLSTLEGESAQLQSLLEHSNDGILIVDAHELVVAANPIAERMLAARIEPELRRTLADYARDHEVVGLVRTAKLRAEPQSRIVDLGVRGQRARIVVAPVANSGHEWVVVLIHDLTRADAAETSRREFVANVSHELRSPIASLKALAETLQAGAIDDPGVRDDFLSRIGTEADRLGHTVEELLELARIEAGWERFEPCWCDLAEIATNAIDRIQPMATRKGISVQAPDDDQHVAVFADPDMLDHVLNNILHNAIKFSTDGDVVAVRARYGVPSAGLTVTDSGMGIAREDLGRLFERFYKADRSRAGGGTGLGLAIAKHLVGRQGGRIWAESDGPGKGSTFCVELPSRPKDGFQNGH